MKHVLECEPKVGAVDLDHDAHGKDAQKDSRGHHGRGRRPLPWARTPRCASFPRMKRMKAHPAIGGEHCH
eukprot:1193918-Prorocentrum_minimum.AAC.3